MEKTGGSVKMKGKMKLSTARWILRAALGVIVVVLALGFVGVFSMKLAIGNAFTIGILYTILKLVFWRCPHCGRLLGGLKLRSDCCYYCEEKLEE